MVLVHFVLHDIPATERPRVVAHLSRKLAPGGKLFIREPLEHLAQDEIVRLVRENALGESRSTINQVPLMGPTYEGVFGKATGQELSDYPSRQPA